jgi:Tol biopolymer transport system component
MVKTFACGTLSLLMLLAACFPASHKSREYKIALVPSRAGQHGIFVMNSDTTGGKLLTPDPAAQVRASSWSPDRKTIAFFGARREDSDILNKYRMPQHFLIYLMDAGGGSQKRLFDFPVSEFEWSPDSRKLMYVSSYEDPAHDDADVRIGKKIPMSAVYYWDFQAGHSRRLTDFGPHCYGSWSPDGASVVLAFGDQQSNDLYAASLDGRHTWRITKSGAIKMSPVWSPDSKRIAYIAIATAEEGGAAGAYIIDANGANNRRIGDVNAYEVSWSPDGKSLLLQSAEGITLEYPDENRAVRLSIGAIQPKNAVFTPDGQEVMFRSNHEGEWYLYAVDLKGSNLRRVSGSLSVSMFCLSSLKL